LPELSGVADGQYDMIAVLDVVEHIEDDVAALEAMAKRLKPGGTILITVPAHQWMWSAHDVVNHHKRRYSKATLIAALERAGLKWRKLGYFN
ncbi:methyltransferase domain-containing protein, partial [Acinetobacter baumannii]